MKTKNSPTEKGDHPMESATVSTSEETSETTKTKRPRKAAPAKAKAKKAKPAKKAAKAKAKSSGTAVDYKKWPQCKTCKRHISNMTRHNQQHKSGEIGDDGKRTAKGLKAAAATKKANAKK